MSIADTAADMEWGECWLDSEPPPPALAAEVKKAMGGLLPEWASRLARVPWVVRAFAHTASGKFAYMPPDLYTLISLVVSQDNSCRYCYGVTRALLKIVGHRDEQIDRLQRSLELAEISPAEKAALLFVRKVTLANPRPSASDLEALARAGFSGPAIAEIAYSAAVSGYHNRIATLFALPSQSFVRWVDHPIARLIRPLIAGKFRDRPHPPMDAPAPNDPPCSEVVAALGGSPGAHTVRRAVDEAFASTILPARTKLLVFAVVGRALGCPHTEAEARRGLAAAGLTETDVDEILANLGSPKLDAREQMLVPFARETVRYRNGTIQGRTRALAEQLPIEDVIEAVGIASLANAIGRMSVIVETC
jgi:AhpD family alkylhydroperoxidase